MDASCQTLEEQSELRVNSVDRSLTAANGDVARQQAGPSQSSWESFSGPEADGAAAEMEGAADQRSVTSLSSELQSCQRDRRQLRHRGEDGVQSGKRASRPRTLAQLGANDAQLL